MTWGPRRRGSRRGLTASGLLREPEALLCKRRGVSEGPGRGECHVFFEPVFEKGKIQFWTPAWPRKGLPEIIPGTTNGNFRGLQSLLTGDFIKGCPGCSCLGTISESLAEWRPLLVKWPVSATRSGRGLCCLAAAYCVKEVFWGGGELWVFFFFFFWPNCKCFEFKRHQIH